MYWDIIEMNERVHGTDLHRNDSNIINGIKI